MNEQSMDSKATLSFQVVQAETEARNAQHQAIVERELHAIARNNRYLNTFSPVNKLLPELLVEVFLYLALNPLGYVEHAFSDFKPTRYNVLMPKPTLSVYSWMAISRVCHRWREVSLNTPKLWSHIYLGPPDRVQVFLERSAGHSVYVRPFESGHMGTNSRPGVWGYTTMFPPRWSINAASLRLVLAQIDRLEYLSLEQPNKVLERVFSTFGEDGFDAPHLKSLKFKFRTAGYGEILVAFPNILSHCRLPLLEHLRFEGYNVPWDSPIMRTNLTSLTIQNEYARIPPRDLQRLPIKELLDVLSHMPSLQSLTIIHSFCEWCKASDEPMMIPKNLPVVELPCLRALTIRLSSPSLEAFIASCRFPSSTKVNFTTAVQHTFRAPWQDQPEEFELNSQNLGSLTSLCTPFIDAQKGDTSSQVPLTAISIQLDAVYWRRTEPDHSFRSRVNVKIFYLEPTAIPLTDQLPPCTVTLRILCRNDDQIPDVIRKLFANIPLSSVTFLNMGSFLDESIDEIQTQLGDILTGITTKALPNLRTLRLAGDSSLLLTPLIENLIPGQREGPQYLHVGTKGLLGTLQNLIICSGSGSWITDAEHSHDIVLRRMCSAIRKEARLYDGECLPFSTLILECWRVPREIHLEMVDSIGELLCQEGRFTQHMPVIAFRPWSPWTGSTALETPDLQDNPDIDLDDGRRFSPVTDAREGDWSDHVPFNQVIFDFKGDGGVKIGRHQIIRQDLC